MPLDPRPPTKSDAKQAMRMAMTHPHPVAASEPQETHERCIGDYLREASDLSDGEVEQILLYQREHGVRFGEAAMALRLASSDDVVAALSQQFHYPYVPTLTERPAHRELVAATNPFGDEAEAFRELRSQLTMGGSTQARPRALSIISPDAGDGRSFVAANIAVSFSQLGGRTLLIDADMRMPRQHLLLGIRPTAGLSDILSGRAERKTVHSVAHLPSLYLMPAGPTPPNPLELLQRPAFGLLLEEVLNKFDHIVVDTPAGVRGADARVIAARTGAAIVIGRTGHSRIAALQALLAAVGKSQVLVAGVVMNDH